MPDRIHRPNLTLHQRTGGLLRPFTFALAFLLASLMIATSSHAAIIYCYPPGDHWKRVSADVKEYWDRQGTPVCKPDGSLMRCTSTYRVNVYQLDGVQWYYRYTYYSSRYCLANPNNSGSW